MVRGILERDETICLSTDLMSEVSEFIGRAVLIHRGKIVGDMDVSELEEQGMNLMEYVKETYNYREDRVSKALSDITGKEE